MFVTLLSMLNRCNSVLFTAKIFFIKILILKSKRRITDGKLRWYFITKVLCL